MTYINFVVAFETWRWEFYAFQSDAEGCPVQTWFSSLPLEHKEEIIDLLDYVRNTTNKPWPENIYNPLRGAGGISEIKVPKIPCERDNELQEITYRMYGFFGPREYEHSYTFLHAAEKEVKNDRLGKQIARGRLNELNRGGSGTGVRKFEFEKDVDSEAEKRPRRPS